MVTAAWLAVVPPASACTSASCSLSSRGPSDRLGAGGTRIELSYRFAEYDRPLRDGHRIDGPVLRPRVDHERGVLVSAFHQEMAHREQALQLDVTHAFGPRLMVTASLPLRTMKSTRHVFIPSADPALHEKPAAPGSVQTYSLGGLGDGQLSASYLALGGGNRLAVGLALKVASGRSDLGGPDGGLADPLAQPGTGAAAVIGSLRYETSLPRWRTAVVAYISHQRSAEDGRGYRFGTETIAVAGATRRVAGPVTAGLLAKLRMNGRNVYRGTMSGSTGGTAVSVTPSARVVIGRGLSAHTAVQVPLVQALHEYQLGERATLTMGVAREF